AGGLACLAADAFRNIDELGDFGQLLLGRGNRRGRAADEVLVGKTRCGIRRRRIWKWRKHRLLLLRYRPGDGLDVDEERLVFRRLDVGVADKGGEHVGAKALLRRSREAPVQR